MGVADAGAADEVEDAVGSMGPTTEGTKLKSGVTYNACVYTIVKYITVNIINNNVYSTIIVLYNNKTTSGVGHISLCRLFTYY